MTGIARVGDTVVGYCDGEGHQAKREFVGVWQTGSENHHVDGAGVVRVGDMGTTDCGHTMIAAEGSAQYSCDGRAVHRVNDVVLIAEGGVGVTQTGSSDSFAGT